MLKGLIRERLLQKQAEEELEAQKLGEDYHSFRNCGMYFSRRKKHEVGVKMLNEAIKQNAEDKHALLERAACYLGLGQPDEALFDVNDYFKLEEKEKASVSKTEQLQSTSAFRNLDTSKSSKLDTYKFHNAPSSKEILTDIREDGKTELPARSSEASLSISAEVYKPARPPYQPVIAPSRINLLPSTPSEIVHLEALHLKAQAFLQRGEFEKALIFFHRCRHSCPNDQMYLLGIQVAEEGIKNSIGSPRSIKLCTNERIREIFSCPEVVFENIRSESKFVTKNRRSEFNDKTRNPTKDMVELLGPMSKDHQFLGKVFVRNKHLASRKRMTKKEAVNNPEVQVAYLAGKALKYLSRRADLWQMIRPMYALERDRRILQTSSRAHLKTGDPMANLMMMMEQIEKAQDEGNYEKSLKKAQMALGKLQACGPKFVQNRLGLLANLYSAIGTACMELELIHDAMDYHLKELEIGQVSGSAGVTCRALDSIGRVKAKSGHYEEAIKIWTSSGHQPRKGMQKAWLHYEIGCCYMKMARYKEARDEGLQSLMTAQNIQSPCWQMHAHVLIGEAQAGLKKTAAVLSAFNKAAIIAKRLNDHQAWMAIEDGLYLFTGRKLKDWNGPGEDLEDKGCKEEDENREQKEIKNMERPRVSFKTDGVRNAGTMEEEAHEDSSPTRKQRPEGKRNICISSAHTDRDHHRLSLPQTRSEVTKPLKIRSKSVTYTDLNTSAKNRSISVSKITSSSENKNKTDMTTTVKIRSKSGNEMAMSVKSKAKSVTDTDMTTSIKSKSKSTIEMPTSLKNRMECDTDMTTLVKIRSKLTDDMPTSFRNRNSLITDDNDDTLACSKVGKSGNDMVRNAKLKTIRPSEAKGHKSIGMKTSVLQSCRDYHEDARNITFQLKPFSRPQTAKILRPKVDMDPRPQTANHNRKKVVRERQSYITRSGKYTGTGPFGPPRNRSSTSSSAWTAEVADRAVCQDDQWFSIKDDSSSDSQFSDCQPQENNSESNYYNLFNVSSSDSDDASFLSYDHDRSSNTTFLSLNADADCNLHNSGVLTEIDPSKSKPYAECSTSAKDSDKYLAAQNLQMESSELTGSAYARSCTVKEQESADSMGSGYSLQRSPLRTGSDSQIKRESHPLSDSSMTLFYSDSRINRWLTGVWNSFLQSSPKKEDSVDSISSAGYPIPGCSHRYRDSSPRRQQGRSKNNTDTQLPGTSGYHHRRHQDFRSTHSEVWSVDDFYSVDSDEVDSNQNKVQIHRRPASSKTVDHPSLSSHQDPQPLHKKARKKRARQRTVSAGRTVEPGKSSPAGSSTHPKILPPYLLQQVYDPRNLSKQPARPRTDWRRRQLSKSSKSP